MTKKNLRPFNTLTEEEQRKIASKGGKASVEARRQRKTMSGALIDMLQKEVTNSKGEKATALEAIIASTIKKAIKGNIKAVQFIRDTIGEMPTAKQEILSANLTMQKVFVTKEDEINAEKHIEDFING